MIKNIRSLVVIGAMVLFPMSVFAEDVPMIEEEIYAIVFTTYLDSVFFIYICEIFSQFKNKIFHIPD